MNSVFFKTAFLVLITFSGFAQDKGKNQISVSVGIFPTEDIAYDMTTRFFRIFVPSHRSTTISGECIFLTYKYFVSERFAVGGAVGYNNDAMRGRYQLWEAPKYNSKTFTMAGEVDFYYLKKRNLSLYALGGIGFFFVKSKYYDNSSVIATGKNLDITMQLTPIGLRFGKSFGGFAEVGYGYKGIVNMGVNVKF